MEEPVVEKPFAEGSVVKIPALEEVVPAEPVPEAQPATAEPPTPPPPQAEGRPAARPGKVSPPGLPTWAIVALFVVAIAGALVVRQQTDVRGRAVPTPPTASMSSPRVGATEQAQPAIASSSVPVSPTPTPKPAVGILQIGTAPAGARVELDGTPVGITPLTLADVKPGRHAVTVSRAGFRSVSREVEIAGGERVILDLTLTPAPPPVPRRVRATPPPPPPPP
ncbi:MAG: PEGA domain-containing protein [Armatimonadota bacterium]|nr:PEGA domain-containing protein [Armatimonadota bacterium]MDR7518994.1 PEGA domain-containing protein [Armatimonadota bacterium]MDR7548887.1 PEGA domain-containing protein [Armatimonadota bacterium]